MSRCYGFFFAVALCTAAFPSEARAADLQLTVDDALWQSAESILARVGNEVSAAPLAPLLVPAQRGADAPPMANLGGMALGIQFGFPTALTLKIPFSGTQGVVFGLGGGFFGGPYPWLSLHADYLIALARLAATSVFTLDFYLGPGLWIGLGASGTRYGWFGPTYSSFGYLGLGVRLPIGLSMRFVQAPVELYLEVVPAAFVFPGIYFAAGPTLGFRWYF